MDKFFLKSKTIIGILITFLVAFLPQVGISFSAEQGQFIAGNVDIVIQALSTLWGVYGRFDAGGIKIA